MKHAQCREREREQLSRNIFHCLYTYSVKCLLQAGLFSDSIDPKIRESV